MSDAFVVISLSTTCDEFASKDLSEIIELSWIIIKAQTLDEVRYIQLGRITVRKFFTWSNDFFITFIII